MVKETEYRHLVRQLRNQGCTSKAGKGDHEKWYCPDGDHMAVIVRKRIVSQGVVHDTVKKLSCLPKGWLQ